MEKHKLALITGASAGIGKSCAYQLGRMGFNLLIVARRGKALEELAREIEQECNVVVDFLCLDLTDSKSVTELEDYLLSRNLKLRVIINNAGGVPESKHIEKIEDDEWHSVFELNFFSIVFMTKSLLPLIDDSGDGRIINISSINAKVPGFQNPHYSAAKAALNNYTKYLSNYLAKIPITVNLVSPGIIETEGWHGHVSRQAEESGQELAAVIQEQRSNAHSKIPLNRLGTADEVAHLVGFLAGPNSSYITGSEFVIDGGKRNEL